MTPNPARSEVWLVDLGMVAKVRPCLGLSIPGEDENDRVLTTLIPHTTSTRDSRFEVLSNVRSLKAGAFDARNIVTILRSQVVRTLLAVKAVAFCGGPPGIGQFARYGFRPRPFCRAEVKVSSRSTW